MAYFGHDERSEDMQESERDELLIRLDERTKTMQNHLASQVETNKAIFKILDDHTKSITTNTTTLFGKEGNDGMVEKLDTVCKSHSTLARSFWILFGLLTGGGVITIGAMELPKVFAR